jgi:invasion protein IalB
MLNMSKRLYTTLSVIVVISLVLAGNICFAADAPADVKSQENNRIEKKFEDWSLFTEEVSVNVQNEKEGKTDVQKVKVHYVTNVVSTKEGQSIVRTDFYYDVRTAKIFISTSLPFGTDVQSDVILRDGNKDLFSSKVLTAYTHGCKTHAEITSDIMNDIVKTKDLKVAFKVFGDTSAKYHEVKISTKGLKKAFDTMKKNSSK